jgi:hypothetical protein
MAIRTNVLTLGIVRRGFEAERGRGGVLSSKFWIPFASVLLWAAVGQAQVAVGPVVGVGYGGYGGWGGVGTAESSAAHGYADYIRSEGEYNLATAQGLVYAEQAQALALRNNKDAWQGYWAGKEYRSAVDAQKRESRRHSAEALNIAGKWNAPQPLSADLLNRETGRIVWPKALLGTKYAAKRREVEKLFELHGTMSSRPKSQAKIQAATGELAALLKSNITSTSATDYMKARKFLDSLAVSAS